MTVCEQIENFFIEVRYAVTAVAAQWALIYVLFVALTA
jgi:hypothetical protein